MINESNAPSVPEFQGKACEVAENVLRAFREPSQLPTALAPVFIRRKDAIPSTPLRTAVGVENLESTVSRHQLDDTNQIRLAAQTSEVDVTSSTWDCSRIGLHHP